MVKLILALALCTVVGSCQTTSTSGGVKYSGNVKITSNSSGPGLNFNTSLTAETAINTPAVNGSAWVDGQTDIPGGLVPDNILHPAAIRVSKGRGTQYDLHSLTTLTTAKILLHVVLWFDVSDCGTSYPVTLDGTLWYTCFGHLQNGHDSFNTTYISSVVNDAWDMGADGFIVDWQGAPNTCGYPGYNSPCSVSGADSETRRNQATLALANAIATQHPSMLLVLMYDEAAYKFNNNCGATGANEPICIAGKFGADSVYANATYFPATNYPKVPYNNYYFFIDDSGSLLGQCTASTPCNLNGGTCTDGASCFQQIEFGWSSFLANQIPAISESWIFQNNGGFTHYATSGAFAWFGARPEIGTSITSASQQDWQCCNYNTSFMSVGQSYTNLIDVPTVNKGFNPRNAQWYYPNNPVTSQRCGQTWLDKWALITPAAASNAKYIQVATYDDWEEATAIEPGVWDCYSAPTISVSGSTLTITVNPTNNTLAGTGSNNRQIQDFDIFVSLNGGTTMAKLASGIAPPTSSNTLTVNLNAYPGPVPGTTYSVFVRQNDKARLPQRMSASTSWTR